METLAHFIQVYDGYAAPLLILAKILGAIFFIPGTPLTLLAGATLGLGYGVVISLIGNLLGAFAAFLIARFFLRDFVRAKVLSKYPKIMVYESRFLKKGFSTVVLLRLIPLFPFNALNYVLGITSVTFRDYAFGTAIGIIPGTIAYVYFGEALMMLSIIHIVTAFAAIIGLTYIGKYYERREK